MRRAEGKNRKGTERLERPAEERFSASANLCGLCAFAVLPLLTIFGWRICGLPGTWKEGIFGAVTAKMKTCFATFAGVLLWVVSAGAIPQTITTPNIFIRSAGMNFEDFASEPDSWDAKSGLKGHWEAHGDTLKLTESATVFGVAADEITAQQKDGQVQSFRVVYRGGTRKAGKAADLAAQVMTNVRAFTGDFGTADSGGGATFKYKAVTITLSSGPGHEVVVEFKRG